MSAAPEGPAALARAPADERLRVQGGDLQTGPAWDRLKDQLGWYEGRSTDSKRAFFGLKVIQLIAAALVPVMASVHAAVWVTGGLGALVVVVEGVQQLCQFQANWINYRSTVETLKHEKYLYLSEAGPYAGPGDPHRLLAERVEATISHETAKWTSGREQLVHSEQDRGAHA